MVLGRWWPCPSSIRWTIAGVVVSVDADFVVFFAAGFAGGTFSSSAFFNAVAGGAACFVVVVDAGLAAAAVAADTAGRAALVAVCAAGGAAGTASLSHLHMLAGQLLSAQEDAHHALNDTALML